MIAGFKEHGFMVAAEHMPDTCTKCPFWLTDLEMQYDGMCLSLIHISEPTRH